MDEYSNTSLGVILLVFSVSGIIVVGFTPGSITYQFQVVSITMSGVPCSRADLKIQKKKTTIILEDISYLESYYYNLQGHNWMKLMITFRYYEHQPVEIKLPVEYQVSFSMLYATNSNVASDRVLLKRCRRQPTKFSLAPSVWGGLRI